MIFSLRLCGLIALVALVIGASISYKGQAIIFAGFSASFLFMLWQGLKEKSYFINFSCLLLFAGFWIKLLIRVFVNKPFVESTGLFYGTPAEWDQVLIIAICGSLGVLLAILINRYVIRSLEKKAMKIIGVGKEPICFTDRSAKWFVLLVLLCSIVLAFLNIKFSFQQIGLVPKTILIWPLNALFYWMQTSGFFLLLSLYSYWSIFFGKGIGISLLAVVLDTIVSGVSIMSRAIFPFHIGAYLLGLWSLRESIKGPRWKVVSAILIVCFIGFFFTMHWVTQIRYDNNFDGRTEPAKNNSDIQQPKTSEPIVEPPSAFLSYPSPRADVDRIVLLQSSSIDARANPIKAVVYVVGGLVVDRWMGLEGVMAVSASPELGSKLMIAGLLEKREIGMHTLYQYISKSQYLNSDASKYMWGTVPGPVAFWYYSGSFMVVAAGMLVLMMIGILVETLGAVLVDSNPFLLAYVGLFLANMLSGFGMDLIGSAKQVCFLILTLSLIFISRRIADKL